MYQMIGILDFFDKFQLLLYLKILTNTGDPYKRTLRVPKERTSSRFSSIVHFKFTCQDVEARTTTIF